MIVVVVALNAWIGFRQEYRAERAIASLQAMATPSAAVVRYGRLRQVAGPRARPGRPRRARGGLADPGRRPDRRGARPAGRGVGADRRVGPRRQANAPGRRHDRARLAQLDGLLGDERRGRARADAGHRDRHGRRARPGRRLLQRRRGDEDAAPAPARRARSPARHRRRRDRPGRRRDRARSRRAARHAAAHGGQPRRRRDPREPPGGGHDHADARRAADAAAAGPDPAPVRGRDARLGDDDLLRQDRHADPEPDDGRRPRHGRRPPRPDHGRRRAGIGLEALREPRRCGCCWPAARSATTPRSPRTGR